MPEFLTQKKPTQEEQILDYMVKHGSITPLEAFNYCKCFRLGARIYDLKKKGYNIKGEIVNQNGKLFSKYILIKATEYGQYCLF